MDNDLAQSILGFVDEDELIGITRDLLRIPSYSKQEHQVGQYLADKMTGMGMEVSFLDVPRHAPNVIGVLKGTGNGPSLMFNGHMDHNMVCEGWTKDPFGAEIENGMLYAIGVANMKSADAAYLEAVSAIQRSGFKPKGDIIIEYVSGELAGGIGTVEAINKGIKADYFIDGEPTELRVMTFHAGVVQLKIHTLGKMRHFSTVISGTNHAIEKMVKVINALGPCMTPIAPGGWLKFEPFTAYPDLPQLNIGVVRGGISRRYEEWRPSLASDFCTIIVDLRTVPGQSPEDVKRDVENLMLEIRNGDPDFTAEVELMDPLEHLPMYAFNVPTDAPIVQSIAWAHEKVTGNKAVVGPLDKSSCMGSDAGHLNHAGMTGVLYGPGGKFLSRPDERVPVQDIVNCAKTYVLTIADLVGLKR